MLIRLGDGDTFTGGPLDVLIILRHEGAGTFHAAFLEESMLPGPIADVRETPIVRLRSKLVHTRGAPDLAGAVVQLDELAARIEVPPENVCRDGAYPWDGEPITMVARNWRPEGRTFAEVNPSPSSA